MNRTDRRAARRGGFSLLEVILSLAILFAALAVVGELVRSGMVNSRAAAAATQAELRAESVLSELVAGSLPLESAYFVPFPDNGDWYYSVLVEPELSGETSLLTVSVTVEPGPEINLPGGKFTVTRWIRDPDLVEQESANATDATTSSTTATKTTE